MTADEERAAIVAWLREPCISYLRWWQRIWYGIVFARNPGKFVGNVLLNLANRAEAGEHLARAHRQVGE